MWGAAACRWASHATPSPPPPPAQTEGQPSLWRVLGLVKPYVWPDTQPEVKARVLLSMGLICGSKLTNVAVPMVFKLAVDALAAVAVGAETAVDSASAVLASPATGWTAVAFIGAYTALRVGSTAMQEARNSIFASVAVGASRALARRLFRLLHAKNGQFHVQARSGALVRTVERSMRAANSLLSAVVLHIGPTCLELALVGGVLATRLGVSFAAIAAVTVALYVHFTFLVTTRRTEQRRRLNISDNAVHAEFADSLAQQATVKLFGGGAHSRARYEAKLEAYQADQLAVTSSLAWLNFGQSAIFSGGLAAVTLLAALRCAAGELTVGDVVLANGLLFQLSVPLNLLGMVYREYHVAITDLGAALTLLGSELNSGSRPALPSTRVTADDVRAHGIDFDSVSFAYAGVPGTNPDASECPVGDGGKAQWVLRDVTFRVAWGETVALVGGSGSGKSTILRLMLGLNCPTTGTLRVGGKDVTRVDAGELRGLMNCVSQSHGLFHDTVEYNVAYPLLARRAAQEASELEAGDELIDNDGRLSRPTAEEAGLVRAAAHRASLDSAVRAMGAGYLTDVGTGGGRLSGGERQRVNLARALIRMDESMSSAAASPAPCVLLCDEPTSALDAVAEAAVLRELRRGEEERCTVLVAHRLATVTHAHRIIVLKAGRVVEIGRHQDLVRRAGGEYARMWRTQASEEDRTGAMGGGLDQD